MRVMSRLKSSSQPGGHAQVAIGDASAAAFQVARTVSSLMRLSEVLVEVEQVAEQAGQPLEPVVEDRLLDGGDDRLVDAGRVLGGLGERRREALDEHAARRRSVPWLPM